MVCAGAGGKKGPIKPFCKGKPRLFWPPKRRKPLAQKTTGLRPKLGVAQAHKECPGTRSLAANGAPFGGTTTALAGGGGGWATIWGCGSETWHFLAAAWLFSRPNGGRVGGACLLWLVSKLFGGALADSGSVRRHGRVAPGGGVGFPPLPKKRLERVGPGVALRDTKPFYAFVATIVAKFSPSMRY
ncbi:MAG: hypothetical protein CM15mP120_25290 [Pseudomonadota bacterium]|nr:MAG: hypothetical protein CM15mP120_25290 [Pseudomonadota bacterium]